VTNWAQWHNPSGLADLLVGLAWLYLVLAGPLRPRLAPGQPWPRAEAIRFFSGLFLVYLAVGSPLSRIGTDYLFFVHILLQLVIVFPAASLVLRGVPAWMIDALLRRPGGRPVWSRLFRPLTAGSVFVLVVSGWYVPRIFGWALAHPAGPAVEGLLFFGASLLFWWPLLSPSLVFPPLPYGGRILYLFAIEVALTGIFTYLLMGEHPLYPAYVLAPRLIPGLSAESDQVLGAVLLSGVSSLVLVGFLLRNFLRWSRADAGPAVRRPPFRPRSAR